MWNLYNNLFKIDTLIWNCKKEDTDPITQNTPHFDLITLLTIPLQCLYDNVSLNSFILVDVSDTPGFSDLYTYQMRLFWVIYNHFSYDYKSLSSGLCLPLGTTMCGLHCWWFEFQSVQILLFKTQKFQLYNLIKIHNVRTYWRFN